MRPNLCDSVVADEVRLVLADRWRDATLFASFRCWDGSELALWAHEVQTYVQSRVLSEAEHTFKWLVDDQLAAVAAFGVDSMELPLLRPDHEEPVWRLRVLALACPLQRRGRSEPLFQEVFRLMRLLDNSRDFVLGVVHPENSWSFKACAAAGLDKLYCRPDGYWVVMGGIP